RIVLGTMNELVFHLALLRESKPQLTEHALGMRLSGVLVTIPPHGYRKPAEMAKEVFARSKGERPENDATARRESPVKTAASIYELKITLRDTKPPIWRQVRVR